jgi:hypothetical protein
MSKMVLIEYTEDVNSHAGRADEDEKKFTIAKGTKRYVDAVSARKLTEGKGARARLVEDKSSRRGGRPPQTETADTSGDSDGDTTGPEQDGEASANSPAEGGAS